MSSVLLGYEVGTGAPIEIPLLNLAVVGQTQESGKTTTLEALVSRSNVTALTFITKRGESAFEAGNRVKPYFRDRADWQFVTSIMDATLQEKNKFLRPWIMRICRTTKTLADVQRAVRQALKKATGMNEGVYTQLDAYLDLIVPEIENADLAKSMVLIRGLNVMDVTAYATPMQMLFVQSAIDWINEHALDTVVVIPEAWEFIPEGKGSPVKASATTLVRKGSGIGNHVWVDSQDMAGVDKVILRGCPVWLIGKQREANEIKRNLACIPAGIDKPKAGDIAMLERGQFYACFGKTTRKVYVMPAWMSPHEAVAYARDGLAPAARPHMARQLKPQPMEDDTVDKKEADELRSENARLRQQNENLLTRIVSQEKTLATVPAVTKASSDNASEDNLPAQTDTTSKPAGFAPTDFDAIWAAIRRRALADNTVLALIAQKPELTVTITRKVIEIDGASLKGRIAGLLAKGFYDDGGTNSGTRAELKRTGPDVNNGNIHKVLHELVRMGFLTIESGNQFKAVEGMKVNVVERDA